MSNAPTFKPIAPGFSTDPFPHAVIENYVSEPFMSDVVRELVAFEESVRKPQATNPNVCYNVDHELFTPYPAIQTLLRHLHSETLFNEMIGMLAPYVAGRLNITPEEISRIAKDPKQRDCYLKLSGPGAPYQVRVAHVDNPAGIFNYLYYTRLPGDYSTGGNLLLHLYDGRKPGLVNAIRRRITGRELELIKSIEYKLNTMVVFLNGVDSFHEVSTRKNASVSRLVFSGGLSADRPLFT